ncbi:hypothetical protein HaLaN_01523, partial [Haematococcus lacustris]
MPHQTRIQEELAARRSWQPGGARSSQEQIAAKSVGYEQARRQPAASSATSHSKHGTGLSERSKRQRGERVLSQGKGEEEIQSEDSMCINGGASTAYPASGR